MPLTGQAKKEYQREYMRSYMSNRRSVKTHPGMLRPSRVFVKTETQTKSDIRSEKAFEITKNVKTSCTDILQEVNSGLAPDGFPIQHTNSMKVGYVPTS